LTDRASLHRAERELCAIVRAKPLRLSDRPSWEHARVSRLRADHDRVSKPDLEAALRAARLANAGQQAEAARFLGVTEGAIRHWRSPNKRDVLPPRWAVERLWERAENRHALRRVGGAK